MAFDDLEHHELLALERALMEARFHPKPERDEVWSSPILSDLHRRLVAELSTRDPRPNASARWQGFLQLGASDRTELQALIRERLSGWWPDWGAWDDEARTQHLENLLAPFVATNEVKADLLEHADRSHQSALAFIRRLEDLGATPRLFPGTRDYDLSFDPARMVEDPIRRLLEVENDFALFGLVFRGCPLRDDDLEPLARLSALRDLDFQDTQIGDEAVPYLEVLSGLRELYLVGTPMTEAAKERLRRELPNTRVK